ncbi:RAMP superfamily CRISPR-associated protein [Saprospira grandis]|uniref:RAMP superfamily CRISPR-associated protein n=1 Tax=Saprospira grandis TaxID=1008 RepID=UPI0022DDE4A5|nr:RAMP superfamily CRISPR-associated protein [Saprospira grandis]WBM74942.1 RAMP superfamily CRISPR-associated protein [Saprospira grandis]
MYQSIKYELQFFSNWHLGSGLSVGADMDATTIKDENGLPYVPGRTLKGIIRDAAQLLVDNEYSGFDQAFMDRVFGYNDQERRSQLIEAKTEQEKTAAFKALDEAAKSEEVETLESLVHYQQQAFFSNAYLSKFLADSLLNEGSKRQARLFQRISSTAIDGQNGIAKNTSLRTIEVCIPLSVYGVIDNVAEEDVEQLTKVLQAIKSMGQSRHRGLGRIAFTILKSQK